MSSAVWVAIIAGVTTLLGGGAVVAWIKSKTEIKLREMEAHYKEQEQIRADVEKLKKQFDDLYSKYLLVLKDYTILQAKYESQQNKVKESQGYKSQELKIGRLTRALIKYHKDQDFELLVKTFDKELIQ